MYSFGRNRWLWVVLRLLPALKMAMMALVLIKTGNEESRLLGVRRQSFWYQSWFKLSESLAHLVNYTMLRACCDASVALRMSFV